MSSLQRIGIMAEMHGRDLTRRHVALALLVALPLSFYLASRGSGDNAVVAGGVGMAFAVSGATLFSILSSSEVDQRLVLGGYRPIELLLGRVLFLAPLGSVIALGFTGLMVLGSDPARPLLTLLGVEAVALLSIPLGLAVGAIAPRELEGTLILIGLVGLQMAVAPDSDLSAVLPLHGPQELISSSLSDTGPILEPLLLTAAWGLALLVVARVAVSRRVAVTRHAPRGSTP